MPKSALHIFMQRLIKHGTVHIVDHSGCKHTYRGSEALPEITARFHSPGIAKGMLLNPDLVLGESYMNGELTVEGGSIYDLLYILASNASANIFPIAKKLQVWWLRRVKNWIQNLSPVAAKSNVAHHYDLPPTLYDLFLDEDRQYSCAYFHSLDNDLNSAQHNKKRHLAAKLRLQPGQTVLDIGCGWGGLALFLAQTANVQVVGLTLSEEQLKIAQQRAQQAGLADRVQFLLQDYREITGKFDRIVSVGMFEHVGLKNYNTFFNKVHSLLPDDGLALLHSIGAEYDPGIASAWILKYIFPGGYVPALSEVLPCIEKQHFHITDIEILHHHYAATLQAWRQRFLANQHQLPPHLDDRFKRMWEYYLASCQVGFQKLGLMNFQIQMMKSKNHIPLTRDYIYETEHGIKVTS